MTYKQSSAQFLLCVDEEGGHIEVWISNLKFWFQGDVSDETVALNSENWTSEV